jgi:GNAT superfamily N-acetyltransferase
LVRPRTPDDVPACVEILADTHRTAGYPVHWPADPAGWLSPADLLGAWVAEVDGQVVGHAALIEARDRTGSAWAEWSGSPAGEAAEVTRLCVTSAARGRSVGRRLLDTVAKAAVDRGRHPILGVLEPGGAAIVLYEHAGWTRFASVDFRLSDGTMTIMRCYTAP